MTREEIPQFKTLEEEKAYWESKGPLGIEAQREEVRRGTEIGYVSDAKFQYAPCAKCGKLRWVMLKFGEPKSKHCRECSGGRIPSRAMGEKHGRWNGGKWVSQGYTMVRLYPDSSFYPMANKPNSYMLEHRLVMAQHLGRCLDSWELVHHINHIRTDNRIENLQLISIDGHTQLTIMENRIRFLEERVAALEAEVMREQAS